MDYISSFFNGYDLLDSFVTSDSTADPQNKFALNNVLFG